MRFFPRVLKNFDDFHKYNVGDKVIVEWEGYDKVDRVATIKSVGLHFKNGEPKSFSKFHCHWKQYYFKEFEGWLPEEKIKEKLQ